MLGQPITRIIPSELHSEEVQILAKLRQGERIEHFETVRVTKDGRHIDISLTVSPIRDGTGTVVGVSKVARDITERKRAEKSQRMLMEELNHRVKNTLAVVQSIANQTLSRGQSAGRICFELQGLVFRRWRAPTPSSARVPGREPNCENWSAINCILVSDDDRISFSVLRSCSNHKQHCIWLWCCMSFPPTRASMVPSRSRKGASIWAGRFVRLTAVAACCCNGLKRVARTSALPKCAASALLSSNRACRPAVEGPPFTTARTVLPVTSRYRCRNKRKLFHSPASTCYRRSFQQRQEGTSALA